MNNLITRFAQNPVLERDTIAGYDSLFNPGAIRFGDKVIVVVRAARDNRFPEPLISPQTWYEAGGRGEDVNNVIFPGGGNS